MKGLVSLTELENGIATVEHLLKINALIDMQEDVERVQRADEEQR
jgi:hypothetical protein